MALRGTPPLPAGTDPKVGAGPGGCHVLKAFVLEKPHIPPLGFSSAKRDCSADLITGLQTILSRPRLKMLQTSPTCLVTKDAATRGNLQTGDGVEPRLRARKSVGLNFETKPASFQILRLQGHPGSNAMGFGVFGSLRGLAWSSRRGGAALGVFPVVELVQVARSLQFFLKE